MPRNRLSRRRPRIVPARAADRARRREELLAAADRVIRRDGPGASMNEIAAEAGITKPILYRHFGDKGGLYQALAERYVRKLMDELRAAMGSGDGPRAVLAKTIDTYLSFVEREEEAYRFLMHRAVGERPEAQATVASFIRQLAQEISVTLGEELRRAGVDSGGADPWAHGIVGMVHLAGDRWLENRSMPRARLVEYLTTLLWNGFSSLGSTGVEPQASAGGASIP